MGIILLVVSLLIMVYSALIEQKNPLHIPLKLQGDMAKSILMLLWISLLLVGGYFTYIAFGGLFTVASVFIYFVLAPIIKKFLSK